MYRARNDGSACAPRRAASSDRSEPWSSQHGGEHRLEFGGAWTIGTAAKEMAFGAILRHVVEIAALVPQRAQIRREPDARIEILDDVRRALTRLRTKRIGEHAKLLRHML